MTLQEVIGNTIKEIWVNTRMDPHGLDEAEVWIKLNNDSLIKFPFDLEVHDIRSQNPKRGSNTLKSSHFKKLKDQKIVDILSHREFYGQTGFYELESGIIIYEVTTFFHGADAVGLRMYNSIEEFESEEGEDYLRFSEQ